MADGGQHDGGRQNDRSTRARLVQATVEVLGERGYDGAAVADIAHRANLTTGAIYGNFRDKATLLREVIAAIEAGQDSNMAQIRESDEAGIELFFDDVRAWVDPARSAQRAAILESRMACRRDAAVQEVVVNLEVERRASVIEVIEIQRERGVLSDDLDVETLATFLLAVPLGLTVLEATGLALPSGDELAALMERLVEALVP